MDHMYDMNYQTSKWFSSRINQKKLTQEEMRQVLRASSTSCPLRWLRGQSTVRRRTSGVRGFYCIFFFQVSYSYSKWSLISSDWDGNLRHKCRTWDFFQMSSGKKTPFLRSYWETRRYKSGWEMWAALACLYHATETVTNHKRRILQAHSRFSSKKGPIQVKKYPYSRYSASKICILAFFKFEKNLKFSCFFFRFFPWIFPVMFFTHFGIIWV